MTDFEERLLKAVERIATAVERYSGYWAPVPAEPKPYFPQDPSPMVGVGADERPTQDGEIIKRMPFVDTSGKPLA